MGSCLFFVLPVIYCFFSRIELSKGYLDDVVKGYDTLHSKDINHGVTKRDVNGLENKVVSFSTLGRKFHLHLSPNEKIFAKDFHAYALDRDGKSKEVLVDKRSFYKGFVEEEPESEVSAYFNQGIMTARIAINEDVYVIEPSKPHIGESSSVQMIAYRRSDVLFNFTTGEKQGSKKPYSFCGYKPEETDILYTDKKVSSHYESGHRRSRRSTATKVICQLALRADHSFFVQMGRSEEQAIKYIVGVIDRVDQIYRATTWSSDYKGFGFEIKEIKVESNDRGRCSDHYNCKPVTGDVWKIKPLLEVFSRPDWSKYCLAHLFTYQDFEDGVIGLAYVGSPKRNAVGGVCTETYRKGNLDLYLNTGLSSSINWGRRLLTEEADIVTAHEIGHNFGSEHDPNTAECAPGGDMGRYIMYPASVSGRKTNNNKFSPCSTRLIDAVLRAKSPICFTEPSGKLCGNWKVEEGEQCDPGNLATKASKCCTRTCKLKQGMQCSDGYESPCCKNCQFAAKGVVCRTANNMTCEGPAKCDGTSHVCPTSAELSDGTSCIEMGKCRNGKCEDYCRAHHNMTSCICADLSNACKFCCKSKEGADDCRPQPLGNKLLVRQDGSPCGQGICDGGVCKKVSQDAIEKFWTWVTELTVDSFAEFMKANIVGAIMFFAAVIWIPVSCFVNIRDKKKDKEEAKEAEWRDPKNTELFRQPKVTKSGDFVYRQDAVPTSGRAKRPVFKPNRSGGRYGRR